MARSRVSIVVVIIAMSCLAGIFTLAFLTKAGYIQNYLHIAVLVPVGGQASYKENPSYNYNPPLDDTYLHGFANYAKPVIYLYPPQREHISVSIDAPIHFQSTYPLYDNGWDVVADSDGTLTDARDGNTYSYLFWDGYGFMKKSIDLSQGFVVEGSKTAEFLRTQLANLGLTPQEYNEFIVYWLPKMEQNKYNLIHFATKAEYADQVPLHITPTPDSVLRVFMVFKGLNSPVPVTTQKLSPFKRHGFSVVEWGGTEL